IDFEDAIPPFNEMRVNLDALTPEQNLLFLAIEQNDNDARKLIEKSKVGKYFPDVPFTDWQLDYTEANLPMFGTIGSLYRCLWQYIEIEYTDDTRLIDYVFNRGSLERDLFNSNSSYHKAEYPLMRTMVTGEIDSGDAINNILDMINAITDQGEGHGVAEWIRRMRGLLQYAPVEEQFQPDPAALDFDYPNYTDTGKLNNPSGQKVSRSTNGSLDHHDRFLAIDDLLKTGKLVTWADWHKTNRWLPEMLKTTGYDPQKYQLPTAED